jgi:hypothetical protein
MIRNFDSSSTLFNMHLEGLGWLRPQGSVPLKNDVLERSDAWIERFCSGEVIVKVSEDLDEILFRTLEKATYQGSHHNKTRSPLNILLLFTEKDLVGDDTISRLRFAALNKDQCFRVFPVGLGSGSNQVVKKMLCLNGGRGVVMTNDRVSFDQRFENGGRLPLQQQEGGIVSNLKGTRDVLLTITSEMRAPYVRDVSIPCTPPIWIGRTEIFITRDKKIDAPLVSSDILDRLFTIQRVKSLESSLRWPFPPGDADKIREEVRTLRQDMLLLNSTMTLIRSGTNDVVGQVCFDSEYPPPLPSSMKRVVVGKRKVFEEEEKEEEKEEETPSLPTPPAQESMWKNLLGFKKKDSKVTPKIVELSSSTLSPPMPPPTDVTSSSIRSEHVKTRIVLLQRADGSWIWTSKLNSLIGPHENAFESEGTWKGCRAMFWATALVCAFMMRDCAVGKRFNSESEIALWNCCARKALVWLQSKIDSEGELERIFLRAESVISKWSGSSA